ncbi:LysR family transcriptional regulator [Hydrogenophaga sp. UC242_50]|uniref:LysR family transcriptional regulator n=1 Tax=Hydrogenophaga sp. UC242_50 TaxID=3350169 RepID=UPI0036D32FAA
MRIRSPSLVELHAFLGVARHGNFHRAADELCVTQAAVSRAVARLEKHLGVQLLDRAASGVRLTPAGADLRRQVEGPVAALEAAAGQVRALPEALRLRLSVVPSLGNLWLMPRLEDFRHRHPEIDIEFRQYHHDEDFTRADVDLWVALKARAGKHWPRQVAAQYLIGREIVAVCAPALAQGIDGVDALLNLPLLYHSNYRDNWALWADSVGGQLPPHWRGTGFDLVMNLIEAARAGMGVAVVQRCMVQAELRNRPPGHPRARQRQHRAGLLPVPSARDRRLPRGGGFLALGP